MWHKNRSVLQMYKTTSLKGEGGKGRNQAIPQYRDCVLSDGMQKDPFVIVVQLRTPCLEGVRVAALTLLCMYPGTDGGLPASSCWDELYRYAVGGGENPPRGKGLELEVSA